MQRFKEEELMLRNKIVSTLFPQGKDEGILGTVDLPEGFQLKATKMLNYNLKNDENQVEALCALLGPTATSTLIRWKPDLSLAAYKKLPKETQDLFNGCLEITQGAPKLEIVQPKEKK